jgi:hypothetical protein
VVIEIFIGTKSRRKFLEGVKRKVGIFIETKNIFNPFFVENITYFISCIIIEEIQFGG